MHGNADEMSGNGRLRFQNDENDDGLRRDVPDVRRFHDARLRHGYADVPDVFGNVQHLRLDVRKHGKGRCHDDGMRHGLPQVRYDVRPDGKGSGRVAF